MSLNQQLGDLSFLVNSTTKGIEKLTDQQIRIHTKQEELKKEKEGKAEKKE